MFIGCSVIITSIGASGAVTASCPDDPRWIDSTVPVSHSAAQSGSQCVAVEATGSPSVAGFSVNVSECTPLAASRRTSSAASSGSHSTGRPIGMNRPGCEPHHSSTCQSL